MRQKELDLELVIGTRYRDQVSTWACTRMTFKESRLCGFSVDFRDPTRLLQGKKFNQTVLSKGHFTKGPLKREKWKNEIKDFSADKDKFVLNIEICKI